MEFASDFFEKEVREGFEVPEMMKRAWAAQMEVLQVVADICNKNGIQYFADWGTLLGAVRHKGFIPWDDDIDICLKREEYNRLIKILPEQLPHGFAMAGMYAKEERLQQVAYVQHLRVIADEEMWNFNDYMKYFHGFPYQGIGVDIFPLDYIPKENELANVQKNIFKKGILILYYWEQLEQEGTLQDYLKEYGKLCNTKIEMRKGIKNWLWKLTDAVGSLYHSEEAEYMANYVYWIQMDGYKLKKEWYDDVVMLPFENIEIPAPAMYDEALKAMFGDYMIPVRGGSDYDYPFYGHLEGELKKQIKAVGFDGTVDEFCREVSSGRIRVKTDKRY